jgi:hypothetical protein
MEAKDVARELVEKFEKLLFNKLTQNEEYVKCVECALIAVQEILCSNPHSNPLTTEVYSTMGFWNKVKNEIEKL